MPDPKKYLDLDGLSRVKDKIVAGFVAKESGKGLSTEDYTTAEKTKLSGIETGAEVNVIESIVINGTTATISEKTASVTIETGAIDSISVNNVPQTIDANKNVNITVPTKTSDLTNDDNVVKDASYVHTDNNYTSAEKTKLSGIAEGAEVNVIDTVKVNGTALTPASKAVDITVPTNNNQLTNGAGYQTASDVSSAIASAISGITSFDYEVVESLPQEGEKGVIYLVSNSGTGTNIYDEYIWMDGDPSGRYEKIGTTEIDLSNYVQFSDLVAITNAEIDTIFGQSS